MVDFKDGFISFKEWYCCFGKYPAKLPANLTFQRRQLDEHNRQEVRRV